MRNGKFSLYEGTPFAGVFDPRKWKWGKDVLHVIVIPLTGIECWLKIAVTCSILNFIVHSFYGT